MKFPIAHDFNTNGVYVCKIDPDSAWGNVKQADGTYKPHKQGLFSKLFEVAATKAVRVPYQVIVVRERIKYDLGGRTILSWHDAHLEMSQMTITGELYSIINGFKDPNKYVEPWAFRIELINSLGSDSIWQSIGQKSQRKIQLKNNGNSISFSSVDMQGKHYTDEYHFMQWAANS